MRSERGRGDLAIHQPTHARSLRWFRLVSATDAGRFASDGGSNVRHEILKHCAARKREARPKWGGTELSER